MPTSKSRHLVDCNNNSKFSETQTSVNDKLNFGLRQTYSKFSFQHIFLAEG